MVDQLWPTAALLIPNFSYFNLLEKLQNANPDLHVIRLMLCYFHLFASIFIDLNIVLVSFGFFYSHWSCLMSSAKTEKTVFPSQKDSTAWFCNRWFVHRCTTSITKYLEQQVDATSRFLFFFWRFFCTPCQASEKKALSQNSSRIMFHMDLLWLEKN